MHKKLDGVILPGVPMGSWKPDALARKTVAGIPSLTRGLLLPTFCAKPDQERIVALTTPAKTLFLCRLSGQQSSSKEGLLSLIAARPVHAQATPSPTSATVVCAGIHGVLPQTPVDNAIALIDAVRELSAK